MLPMVLIAFSVVAMRYVLNVGFPWLQETYIWLHGAAVLLASAWVLQRGGHVRVGVFYAKASERAKAWIDIAGVLLFLMPMMSFLYWWSIPLVQRSWRLMERSPTADGLSFVYLMKTVIPIFCVLMMLQGLSLLLRSVLTLVGRKPPHG